MPPRKMIGAVAVVLLIAAGLWWFARPAPEPISEKVISASNSDGSPSKPSASGGQIAAPKTPPAPSPTASMSATSTAKPAAFDPQADLKTAIPDIVSLIHTENYMTLLKNYTRPEILPKLEPHLPDIQEGWNHMSQKPFRDELYLPDREQTAQSWESLEKETPTYNAAGDEATYASGAGSKNSQEPVTFVKINGKWYLKGIIHLGVMEIGLD